MADRVRMSANPYHIVLICFHVLDCVFKELWNFHNLFSSISCDLAANDIYYDLSFSTRYQTIHLKSIDQID